MNQTMVKLEAGNASLAVLRRVAIDPIGTKAIEIHRPLENIKFASIRREKTQEIRLRI